MVKKIWRIYENDRSAFVDTVIGDSGCQVRLSTSVPPFQHQPAIGILGETQRFFMGNTKVPLFRRGEADPFWEKAGEGAIPKGAQLAHFEQAIGTLNLYFFFPAGTYNRPAEVGVRWIDVWNDESHPSALRTIRSTPSGQVIRSVGWWAIV